MAGQTKLRTYSVQHSKHFSCQEAMGCCKGTEGVYTLSKRCRYVAVTLRYLEGSAAPVPRNRISRDLLSACTARGIRSTCASCLAVPAIASVALLT